MSKLADRLQSLSKSSTAPIGFHASVSEAKSPAMLLIVGLSAAQTKEAKIMTDVNADAGLILSDDSSAMVVREIVEAAGDIPVGISVKSINEEKVKELASLGCDFVVFDVKAPAAVLHGQVGRFLMVEPSLDPGLARAINSLELDGVFVIGSKGKESSVTVEHLLACRRLVELLEKPALMVLPSLVTRAELASLWQAGVDGVVAPATESIEMLANLKKMIDELPRKPRAQRARIDAVLPRYGGLAASETEEEEDET
jgi:hypothetical protein